MTDEDQNGKLKAPQMTQTDEGHIHSDTELTYSTEIFVLQQTD